MQPRSGPASYLDVVIVGGPKAPENVPDWCDVAWAPSTLRGLDSIKYRVANADLLVYWPDWRLLGQYPRSADILEISMPTWSEEDKLHSSRRLPKKHYMKYDMVRKFLSKGSSDDLARFNIFSYVLSFVTYVMEQAHTVVQRGRGVVLVVPSDFREWGERGAESSGDAARWKGRATESFNWLFRNVIVSSARSPVVTESSYIWGNAQTVFFDLLIGAHSKCVEKWPFIFSIDERALVYSNTPGGSVCGGAEVLSQGIIVNCNELINFGATVLGNDNDPLNMVFTYCAPGYGGFIVMPEPSSLDAFLGCLPRSLLAEKASLADQCNAGAGVRAAEPLINEDDCRKAKKSIEALLERRHARNPIVGESDALLPMYSKIWRAVINPREHVFVHGETGSGKQLIYELLRTLSGPRHPFLIENVRGLTETHLISKVFGHEDGAYTGATGRRKGAVELAAGGTLVLDNVQTESLEFYQQLLEVMEKEQRYQRLGGEAILNANCRIVLGTNRPMEELLALQKMPEDIPRRLRIRIEVPSLNMRRDDIPILVRHFAAEFYSAIAGDLSARMSLEQLQERCSEQISRWQSVSWGGAAGNVGGLEQAVRNYIDVITADERRPSVLVVAEDEGKPKVRRGRPVQISSERIKQALHTAMEKGWSWEALRKNLTKDDKKEPAYTTLQSFKGRINKEDWLSPEQKKYVELLTSAVENSAKVHDGAQAPLLITQGVKK